MNKIARRVAALLALALALGPAVDAAAVDAPRWVAVLYVDAQKAVGLRWMPVPGATAYKVLRSETARSGYQEIASSPQPQHFDSTVQPGSTYYYVLQTVAGAEASPNSEERSIAIPGQKVVKVSPPEWVKAALQQSTEFGKTSFKVGLVWKAIPKVIAYNVYRSTEPGTGYQLVTSIPESQFIDATVEKDKTYYYTLSALDESFQETPMSAEQKVEVKEEVKAKVKKRVKLQIAPRPSKVLWSRTDGDAGGLDLKEVSDIAIDEKQGLVYATSANAGIVVVLKMADGESVRTFGETGEDPGQFLTPIGLDVTPDGTVYVADKAKGTVEVFGPGGAFLRQLKVVPPPELAPQGRALMDVAVKGGEAFVSDRANHRVWVIDAQSGAYLRTVGVEGLEPGQTKVPQYLKFNPAGNLTVVNANQTRIDTYDPKSGQNLHSFGVRKPGIGTFVGLAGFDYDADGNLLMCDRGQNNIQGFTLDGRYLFHLADEKGEKGQSLFVPKSIAVDKKGVIYVIEGLVNRIKAMQMTAPSPAPQEEAD